MQNKTVFDVFAGYFNFIISFTESLLSAKRFTKLALWKVCASTTKSACCMKYKPIIFKYECMLFSKKTDVLYTKTNIDSGNCDLNVFINFIALLSNALL